MGSHRGAGGSLRADHADPRQGGRSRSTRTSCCVRSMPRRTQAQLDAAQADVQRLTRGARRIAPWRSQSRRSMRRARRWRARRRPRLTPDRARPRRSESRQRGLNSQADLDNANAALRTRPTPTRTRRARIWLNCCTVRDRKTSPRARPHSRRRKRRVAQLQVTLQRLSACVRRAPAASTRCHSSSATGRRPGRQRRQLAGRRCAVCARLRAGTAACRAAAGRALQVHVDGVDAAVQRDRRASPASRASRPTMR